MITQQDLDRAEAIYQDMATKWDRCTLDGNKPVAFFACSEDVELMCKAAYVVEETPTYRGTRIISFSPNDYAFLGWAYVVRKEDRIEIERVVRARGYTGEFAEVEPGTLWILAEENKGGGDD